MKRIIILLLVISLCVFSYLFGFNSSAQKKSEIPISKIDYPLIDVSFDDESDWLVIVRTDLFTEYEKYWVSQKTEDLHMNKESLMLSTFPVGRGTTPAGVVYIYQNKELIKEVPFTEIFFENDIIKEAFNSMTKEDVDKLIDSPLPSPI